MTDDEKNAENYRQWQEQLDRNAAEAIERYNERYGNRGGLESSSDRENKATRDRDNADQDTHKKEN